MLVGDLLEGAAALIATVAVFLVLSPLVSSEIALGVCLLAVAAFVAYVARVHGGVELRKKRESELSGAESS